MKILISTLFTLTLFLSSAQAGILIDTTRIIYPADKQEVTLNMTNNANSPRLIQTWVDDGGPDSNTDNANVPFIVTPPIFRIDAAKRQTLRIMYTGDKVPQDRESVFWLNVLEIQPKSSAQKESANDYVQFSIRSRLKLFYRPKGLSGSSEEAVSTLRWRVAHGGVECINPSPFNISFHKISLSPASEKDTEYQHGMCQAKGTTVFSFQEKANEKIFFTTIDDYGGLKKHEARLSH
ncbi:molecular chaperone [Phytobacter diazotrophicus]|uniref:fimbrial biogenesis chaperone n=1 Tax=Phytobacter diazotrophicus TaxID=395631 RepID=UPI00291189B6|nr:molecular chaperone [Phytobacter diazotrophicus]MDU7196674.1 molecular chaperone [Enterobacteriaceae bacterium]MDV2873393.1 molecular chaperone [Phytobacter diazotrophicus]